MDELHTKEKVNCRRKDWKEKSEGPNATSHGVAGSAVSAALSSGAENKRYKMAVGGRSRQPYLFSGP